MSTKIMEAEGRNNTQGHPTVSQEEWLVARKELLTKEKELTRLRDQLSSKRRELPWVKVEKRYVFDAPQGKEALADLFDGRSQLIVYHFMFGPDWKEGCPICSAAAEHINSSFIHLAQRDVTLIAISRAPLAQIQAFKKRMGWRFKWLSSLGSDFNCDYGVSFTKDDEARGTMHYNYGTEAYRGEEVHGLSVFSKKETGDVFHTYSAYARGPEEMLGFYFYLDRVPKGRNENGLDFPMSWVRHKDKYDSVLSH
jgi:predicted dithiol-disulfide oxidoreductase (DUF899 family)